MLLVGLEERALCPSELPAFASDATPNSEQCIFWRVDQPTNSFF